MGPVGQPELEQEPHLVRMAGEADRLGVEAVERARERLGERPEAAAGVERLHLAEPVDVDGLDARQRLPRLDVAVAEHLRGLRVVVEQLLGRVREAVAERHVGVRRHVADADAGRRRRLEARDAAQREHPGEARREPAAGDHVALPPLGEGVERAAGRGLLGEVRPAEVDEVGAELEREPREAGAQLRPDARHHAGAPGEDRLERLRVAGVGLVRAEVGVGVGGAVRAQRDRAGLADLHAGHFGPAAEVVRDGRADRAGAEDGDLHGGAAGEPQGNRPVEALYPRASIFDSRGGVEGWAVEREMLRSGAPRAERRRTNGRASVPTSASVPSQCRSRFSCTEALRSPQPLDPPPTNRLTPTLAATSAISSTLYAAACPNEPCRNWANVSTAIGRLS